MAKYFTVDEYKCKCGCGESRMSPMMLELADAIRELWGAPLKVNSGCRCSAHNKAEGGVSSGGKLSYHVPQARYKFQSSAMDLAPQNPSDGDELWAAVLKAYKDKSSTISKLLGGLGRYGNRIHVDTIGAGSGTLRQWDYRNK